MADRPAGVLPVRVVVTGSSGRIGRAIFNALVGAGHEPIGVDRSVFSTTHYVGDIGDIELLRSAMEGADAVIHAAALHAPHVGVVRDSEFKRINVDGTKRVFDLARAVGIERFVFTSTTALYGDAIRSGACTWVDEDTEPQPRTIYHRTKLAAEDWLESQAGDAMQVRVLRMSRCFPEPADRMALYRLHRGVDARDVADAHVLALSNGGAPFQRYVISAATPFRRGDCAALTGDARSVIRHRVPGLTEAFRKRNWSLPTSIDRVYASCRAQAAMCWRSTYGFEEVIRQCDEADLEVLPPLAKIAERPE